MDYRALSYRNGKLYNVVVEIPKGTKNKYEVDETTGTFFRVNRRVKIIYPFNYGFIPQTIAGDGDQTDAVIINAKKIDKSSVVKCRVLGGLINIDEGKSDNKLIFIPEYVRPRKKKLNIFDKIGVFLFFLLYKKNADLKIKFLNEKQATAEIENAHAEFAKLISGAYNINLN